MSWRNINRNTAKTAELVLLLEHARHGELTDAQRERIYKAFQLVESVVPPQGHSTIITETTLGSYVSKIALWSSGDLTSYPFTYAGLSDANTRAVSGDTIFIVGGTITITGTFTVAAGVEVAGYMNTVLSGTVTNNGILTNLTVTGTLTNNGKLYGVINPAGNLNFTTDTTITGDNTINGDVLINEAGTNANILRVEGDNEANLIITDAVNDRVGIATAAPTVRLDVTGDTLITGDSTINGDLIVNEAGTNANILRVEGDNDANLIITDAVNDRVGIKTAAPTVTLDVTGDTLITGATSVVGTTSLDGAVTANESGADVDFRIEGSGEDNLFRVDAGTDSVHIGDWDTNYAKFAVDGELSLVGTARVKKEFAINATALGPGATGPTQTILGNSIGYAYGIGDDSVVNFEIPYECDTSEDLKIEIYWYINEAYATNSGEVQWRAQWSACPVDATEAIDAPTHTGTIDFGDQDIPATAKYLTEVSGTIAAASISDGDFISMTIDRVALDGGSNPAAEPVIVQIEVEYTSHRLGEAT